MADVETLYDRYFLEYATYVVKNRAIPEIDDGLKPVQRRILHTLFEIDDGKYHKVANVVGQTMQFHPHGDQSIFGALVSLANKDLFIDKQGNFGSVLTGGQASAARYIECRLTPLAREVLLSPDITEYVDSYDGRAREPVVFPAKVPVALILGAEGIAVGMSTRILPHNPIEVMEAQVSCLKGEPFHLFPDFPTGGLMDVGEYEDGNGRVYTRALLEPREDGAVLVRALPFGETTESLMKSIEEASRSKRVAVTGLTDYTTDGVEIEIRTDPGAETADVLRGLYAFTSCEVAIDANLLVISDGHPRVMTVTDMIRHSTNRLLEILEAELKIEERELRARLRARRLEQVFIENRIYKEIEDVEEIEGVYAAVRGAIAKHSPVSTTARAVDRGMNELNAAPAEIRDAARSLLTTVYRSLAFEHYGPSREMIARNLDAICHGPAGHRRLVRSLLSAIRHELTATRRMAAVEDIITADNLTREDVDRLLDIPIYRITRYGIDRAEAEMREIEGQLRTVLHNLHHLTDFAIDFLEQLIRAYRDEYPRRSEVKPFTPVQERDAAARDLALRYDTETGYMGYTIESGRPLFNVSLYDRVVIVRSGGVAGVHNTLDKMYVDLDILYCAMEEPGRVFTVAYRDLEGYACIKRCRMDRCRINQLYELVPGDSSLLAFTAEPYPEIVLIFGDGAAGKDPVGQDVDGRDADVQDAGQERRTREHLKAADFAIRSHRARGDRIEQPGISDVEFVIRNREDPGTEQEPDNRESNDQKLNDHESGQSDSSTGSNQKQHQPGKVTYMSSWRLMSWNVNGVRAVAKKGFLEWFQEEAPDILCLQETKSQESQLDAKITDVAGYQSYWSSAEKKGYSGVGVYSRHEPLSVAGGFGEDRFDSEGRTLVLEYPDFTLFNVYFPNGKQNAQRLQYKMDFYDAILAHWESLRADGKKLVICGDVNTAHKEIDLARPKENEKISGFLPMEREWIDKIMGMGYVDTFRQFDEGPDNYTWWHLMSGARKRNVGWRIDYFYVTEDLMPAVSNAWIASDVMGSDHCPIGIEVGVG